LTINLTNAYERKTSRVRYNRSSKIRHHFVGRSIVRSISQIGHVTLNSAALTKEIKRNHLWLTCNLKYESDVNNNSEFHHTIKLIIRSLKFIKDKSKYTVSQFIVSQVIATVKQQRREKKWLFRIIIHERCEDVDRQVDLNQKNSFPMLDQLSRSMDIARISIDGTAIEIVIDITWRSSAKGRT